jgi:small subunit ribosomal protein S16
MTGVSYSKTINVKQTMPVKIRLQRHGKKGKPYFHIVVADARAPRDGKYIERLGFYNPNTNPATIDIDVDGAVKWLGNGAQPTDTARAILSYKGVLYKNHLLKGVKKGALSTEEAETRYAAWIEEKSQKIDDKKKGLTAAQSKAASDRLAAETEVNKAREAAIAAANAPEPVAEEVVEEAEAPQAEANAEEVAEAPAEETKAEVAAEEVAEAPAEEPKAEVAAEEVEAPAEEPKAETAAEEAPAEGADSEEEKK